MTGTTKAQIAQIILSILGGICMFMWSTAFQADSPTAWYWALGAVLAFVPAAVIAVALWRRTGRTTGR